MLILLSWILLTEFTNGLPRTDNCLIEKEHLICQKHPLPDNLPKDIRNLELHEIEWEAVDMNIILEKFPLVENVSIFGGHIQKFVLPKIHNKIKVLQLERIKLEAVGSKFLRSFPNLEYLNLEGNYLQNMKNNFSTPKLKTIYLNSNRWNCSLDLKWVYKIKDTVKDIDNLTCYGEPHAGKPILAIAYFMKDLDTQCPPGCKCSLPKVVLRNLESDHLEPIIEVNCSYRGFTELPQKLPPKTKIVKLEGNEIVDIKALKQNPTYKTILDLYLDNNKIASIEELEGSYWLKHFRVFSLSGNKLTELPTYALDNALEQNANMPNAVRISLGGNPWRCDCVFTPVFQEMLQKFASQIQDINEIKCSYVEGDENSLLPIIELSRSSVCRSPTEYSVQALDLLNAVLASLILLILGKLAYDYYYFKKTGRLPWIVTKMP